MDGQCTIFVDDGLWRLVVATEDALQLHDVDLPDGEPINATAQRVSEWLTEHGLFGPVMLALPSDWCLTASVETVDLGRANRRQSLRYLLEEQLPISAEDSVADFVEHQATAMGVAVDTERLSPIVDALQAHGIGVNGICPTAFLTAAALIQKFGKASAIAMKHEGGIDLIELNRQNPTRWWWLPPDTSLHDQLVKWRETMTGDGEDAYRLVTFGLSGQFDGLDEMEVVNADDQVQSAEHLAASYAADLLAGEALPWIDLRRDALSATGLYLQHQKQIGILVAAMTFFLLCVIGATYWRSGQYQEHTSEVDSELIGLYKQAMPSQRVPASGMIMSRLQSEQRRLAGIGGQPNMPGASMGEALQPTSALKQLHTVLSALPNTLRYRISDMTIEPNLIRVNGQAADAVIPDKLAESLRGTGAYQVDPANTRALSDFGFSFGFLARPIAGESAEDQEGTVQ